MDIKSSFFEERRISHVTGIMNLPWVIMDDTFSRLSIKSIFLCKIVCKLWYNILYFDPLFVNIYQTDPLIFPAFYDQSNSSLLELKAEYGYYARHCNRPIQLTPKFHFPPRSIFYVGSCEEHHKSYYFNV
ncbi:hypothetical protein H5410_051326 [Solanum commersonii]|uniref:F-box domain-containing protein n=1 Tax=Solanum commersonii TaxID=4109 RepID=A0A9J5WY30_SOLCO|nr:hypothetical protein H5410_051326 [Solanum commersonii]